MQAALRQAAQLLSHIELQQSRIALRLSVKLANAIVSSPELSRLCKSELLAGMQQECADYGAPPPLPMPVEEMDSLFTGEAEGRSAAPEWVMGGLILPGLCPCAMHLLALLDPAAMQGCWCCCLPCPALLQG